MIKITNGEQTLTVSKGAFRELYLPSGWLMVGNIPSTAPQESPMASMGDGDSKPTSDQVEPSGGHAETSEEDAINGMSEMELKQYASLLGIKTRNLKTREELLAAIKSHQK